jgi:hypothetical protein
METKIPDDGFVPGPAPVGMNPPGVGLPMGPAPEPDFAESICLKGPCQHLWVIKTSFAHGNPAGTFKAGEEPKKTSRSCTACTEEMDLEGITVFECNRWCPLTESERLEKARRELDFKETTK